MPSTFIKGLYRSTVLRILYSNVRVSLSLWEQQSTYWENWNLCVIRISVFNIWNDEKSGLKYIVPIGIHTKVWKIPLFSPPSFCSILSSPHFVYIYLFSPSPPPFHALIHCPIICIKILCKLIPSIKCLALLTHSTAMVYDLLMPVASFKEKNISTIG